MTLSEYQQLAGVTARKDRSESERLIEATLGLNGETAEVVQAMSEAERNLEYGDVLWYVAEICSDLHIQIPTPTAEIPTKSMQCCAGTISDIVKKWYAHGRSIDVSKVTRELQLIMNTLSQSTDIVLRCEENIAKLKARHPSGFRERG